MEKEVKENKIRIEIENGDTIYSFNNSYGLDVLLNEMEKMISILEDRKFTDDEYIKWLRYTDTVTLYLCAEYDIPMVDKTIISIYNDETNEPFIESYQPFI